MLKEKSGMLFIENALSLKYPPLAIFYAEEPPVESKKLKPLCVMSLVAEAAKGATVALSKGGCGCPGAASGFCLEPHDPDNFPGGRACYFRFLSIGNKDWEQGRAVLEQLTTSGAPKIMTEEFSEGEGFLKTPDLVETFTASVPYTKPEGTCVVIKPLKTLRPTEKPKVVTFLANPDQLSALVGLVHFTHPQADHVKVPFGAGCQCFGAYPFHEAEQEDPKAVIGLMDISARFYLDKLLGDEFLSLTVPLSLYREMESNVEESFLTRFAWQSIMKSRGA
ncbi:MAG: DUF169 domain-containing protein [Proteiniphilum sp.]|jgi:uncharacterized protein (DUF169 family)|nr:DUF169 domain-containing protein [Proteiniphilum sp.]